MIIELGKYNKVGELLIGTNTIEPLGHVLYWTWSQKVYVNMVAVQMRRMGMEP